MGRPTLTPRHDALDAWGRANLRDLPWRHTRDPWKVLVAEVMSQQTQISRVVPRWGEFLGRFPNIEACAVAPQADVLRIWIGLGYPRRARDLHATAQLVTAERAGALPADIAQLQQLPGIGGYTSRAVAAFAFEVDVGVLDTNVGRILARYTGTPLTKAAAQELADSWVPPGGSFRHNATMLDLGAMLCRPRQPNCSACPLAERCSWRVNGGPDPSVGSAAVSRPQARFIGSDRQLRGRVLALLAAGPSPSGTAEIADDARLGDRADIILSGLQADDLISEIGPGLWTLGAADVTML